MNLSACEPDKGSIPWHYQYPLLNVSTSQANKLSLDHNLTTVGTKPVSPLYHCSQSQLLTYPDPTPFANHTEKGNRSEEVGQP